MPKRGRIKRTDPIIPIEVEVGTPTLIEGEGFKCKRYLIFTGRLNDVRGGLHDLHGTADTVTDALYHIAEYCHRQKTNKVPVYDWFQVFDLKRMKVVRRSVEQPYKQRRNDDE